MANKPQTGGILHTPQAEKLLKDRAALEQLLRSPDTQALMAIKSQGASSQDEVAQAIRTVSGLNNTVRGMLWQLQNKSWKTKNNPFSESAGYRVKTNYEDPEPLSLPTLDD